MCEEKIEMINKTESILDKYVVKEGGGEVGEKGRRGV